MEDKKEKAKIGRPPIVFTDEQITEIEALSAYLSIEMIADYLGINQSTFIAIKERDDRVFQAYKRGKARAIGSVAKSLVTQARDGNIAAAIFYLKTQARWKEETDPIAVVNNQPVILDPEKYEEIREKMLKDNDC